MEILNLNNITQPRILEISFSSICIRWFCFTWNSNRIFSDFPKAAEKKKIQHLL